MRGRCDRENYVRLTETIRSRKPEFLMKACLLADKCARYKVSNTRIVWVPNCYIDPKNELLKRPAPSGTWHFPTHVAFSTGISIPIPSAVQIALCSRWYCYLVFVSRDMQKNVHGTTMTKICQLWRPTYLPPQAPRKAAPKGAGVAGEVAQYHGRFCFCCAHALMCGFQ